MPSTELNDLVIVCLVCCFLPSATAILELAGPLAKRGIGYRPIGLLLPWVLLLMVWLVQVGFINEQLLLARLRGSVVLLNSLLQVRLKRVRTLLHLRIVFGVVDPTDVLVRLVRLSVVV